MDAKIFRNVLLFLCNKWSKGEANLIFNGSDFDPEKWKYSIGEHIWNKWLSACKSNYGSLNCIAFFLLEFDDSNLQKLIDRATQYYNE